MFESASGFENEVRRIARLLWPSAQFDGAVIEDGRERDGIFETSDFVHVLECTMENPFVLQFDTETWQNALMPLGAQVAAFRALKAGYAAGRISAAIRSVLEHHDAFTVAADLALVILEMGASYEGDLVYVREVIVPELRFDDPASELRLLEFQDSVIGLLCISAGFPAQEGLPKFLRCHIGAVEGRTGALDLPSSRFSECDIDAFEEPAQTTKAIMDLALPLGTKVMLTVLKKLYAQSGAGRKESAFYRGLDSREQSRVDDVLALLRREEMAIKSSRGTQQIWLPTRSRDSRKRALGMLAAPNASTDPLIGMSKSLS